MDIADDVERSCIFALVGPERLTDDGRGFDVIDVRAFPHLPKAFALQAAEATPDLGNHSLHDLSAESAVGPGLVARDANVNAGVEHDGDRQGVLFAGELDPAFAFCGADVRGVDDRKLTVLQALAGNFTHQVECIRTDA